MRINRTAIGCTLLAFLVNGPVAFAQRAGDGRVGVSRDQAAPRGSASFQAARDTTVATATKEVRSGTPMLLGGVIGALAGVVYTIGDVNNCEKQPGNNDMKGLCGIGYITLGPVAAGAGALAGGFLGWLVARSEREPVQ